MTRATTQRDILQVLQEAYPEALRLTEIARRAGYTPDTVKDNLHLMDTVMLDLRYKMPHWRPKYKYLPKHEKTNLPKATEKAQLHMGPAE